MNDEPLLFTVAECAEKLRISENHAYNLVDQGLIPSVRFGKIIRVPRWALLRLLATATLLWAPNRALMVSDRRRADHGERRRLLEKTKPRLKLGPSAGCGQDDATIFTNLVGKPMDAGGLKRSWKRILRDAGIGHVRFHDLRHASATFLLRAGVPVKVVAERLGHSRTSTTTDTYAHVMPGMGREAAEALESLMVKGWSKAKEA